jgi:hypothetical protein
VGAARNGRRGRRSSRRPSRKASARLAPGVTPEAATRELVDLVPAMRKDLARPNQWGQAMRVQKLQDAITGDVGRPCSS